MHFLQRGRTTGQAGSISFESLTELDLANSEAVSDAGQRVNV